MNVDQWVSYVNDRELLNLGDVILGITRLYSSLRLLSPSLHGSPSLLHTPFTTSYNIDELHGVRRSPGDRQ